MCTFSTTSFSHLNLEGQKRDCKNVWLDAITVLFAIKNCVDRVPLHGTD